MSHSIKHLFNSIIHKNYKFSISKVRLDHKLLLAMISVKGGHPLVSVLLRSLYTMGGKITPNWARICTKFAYKLNLLCEKGGGPQVVKYLKVCSVITQQVAAGYRISDLSDLGMRISRSKSGLPRIIPKEHRNMILKGDKLVLKFWLTQFSLYRDIHFDGEFKLNSITSSSTATSTLDEFLPFTKAFKDLFFKPCDMEFSSSDSNLFQILTSGPQVMKGEFNTHPSSIIRSIILFKEQYPDLLKNLLFLAHFMKCTRVVELIHSLLSYWLERANKTINNKDSFLGRLAIKEEAAGKVRVFAMVDPLTQWVLNPLHKNLFKILKRIPMDGTFNQLKPLERVPFGLKPLYSYDLSSATDRLPLSLQKIILKEVYGQEFAQNWGELLVGREYASPRVTNKNIKGSASLAESYKYTVGQPMGALSSWAMLAITHHFIVQTCAWKAGICPKTSLFTEYAVLGDDIVIWNKTVASHYLSTLKSLGVKVGLAKSIISKDSIGIEFAKRTIIKGIDVSPVPYKEQTSAHMKLAALKTFAAKNSMSHLAILRFLGYGYQVNEFRRNKINQALKTAWSIPTTSEELKSIFCSYQPYMNINFKGSYPAVLRKKLCSIVLSELVDITRRANNMHVELIQYSAACFASTIMSDNPGHDGIKNMICESNFPKMESELSYLKETSKVLVQKLQHHVDFYSSFLWDTPEVLLTPEQRLEDIYFQSALKFIFKGQNDLDAIQCSNLIHPQSSISVAPSYLEEQRVLRLWSQWAQTFIMLQSTAVPQVSYPRSALYPLSKILRHNVNYA